MVVTAATCLELGDSRTIHHYSLIADTLSVPRFQFPLWAMQCPGLHFVMAAAEPNCWGRGSSISSSNFVRLPPAVQKLINRVPFRVPTSTYPSAKYEPRTCPHSKVVNQPTLHSLYPSTSLMCISMHIHEAPISRLRRTARITVVTEASRTKLLLGRNPSIVGKPFYFRFSKDCSTAEILP
jgi:hypothetical protein